MVIDHHHQRYYFGSVLRAMQSDHNYCTQTIRNRAPRRCTVWKTKQVQDCKCELGWPNEWTGELNHFGAHNETIERVHNQAN